jgi:2-oxoglutarate dehydrogenase E1 component
MSVFGQNRGYIDELYAAYRADPSSVSEAWREFFAGYRPEPSARAAVPAAAPPSAPAAKTATPEPAEGAQPLRGVALRIAENMQASLAVPTATSSRTIPVKLLEENRRVVNQHQLTVAGTKVSFTQMIAWAVVRALERHPAMNARFLERDGKPYRVSVPRIRLGLAVDLQRGTERVLLVPNLDDAAALDFPGFSAAMDSLVERARRGELAVEEFQGTTVTLTNPGMIGTVLSVPRLMPGQGAIVGIGSIGYPAEYAGMGPELISHLGLSKVMTVTSTYDHRVIQGAESGAFLATLDRLLQGGDGFYERIFKELGVPHEPMEWSGDLHPQILAGHAANTEAIAKQAGVLQLIRAYRVRGHLWADLDPLGYAPESHPDLELSGYGLTVWDLDRRFIAGGLGGSQGMLTLREILDVLRRTYCRHVGVEYMHIQDGEARQWLQKRLEHLAEPDRPPRELQVRILKKLNVAEAFETFLATNYVGQKRFSLEGAETLIPMLDSMIHDAAASGVEEVIIGMAHRGRLNVLANLVSKSYGQIFREFEGDMDPRTTHGSGDVKYHLGASGSYETEEGKRVRVSVASNPSHLEAVDPVVEGMARALQDRLGDTERVRVLPVLIHGDAAFAGQGVVTETLNLSQLVGYRTGGTLHIVVNNKIGFTTGPADQRSSQYATDVAKMLRSPIFHVNGDHPEEAVRVMLLAFAFRREFKRDVVVDLVCYRRWGHNEADDPSYTHPELYARIEQHRSVRKLYTEQLVRRGDFDRATAEQALDHFRRELQQVHDEVRRVQDEAPAASEPGELLEDQPAEPLSADGTGVPRERLAAVLEGLERTPPGFQVHPKLVRQLAQRRERFAGDHIDWALAESLAFGSLVLDGRPVRLSGEDSGRGTFSQRHATLYDYASGRPWVPLDHLAPSQARFQVYDSLLSEFAVLGFEYGYSVNHPEALVLWEAQFGDFVNGAQVIIDQFICSAERKWGQRSSVVLLLPHGYEGQGPEHSSARIERFLQLAALGNIRVACPSTPAQYFHLLRAQAATSNRKPLIAMTPKSLLRHRQCVSSSTELVEGSFRVVLDDPEAPLERAERLLLTSGKIHYDLEAWRRERGIGEVAICRLEQLYPFPRNDVARLLARAAHARDVVWVQEEPKNMGGWGYVAERVGELVAAGQRLRYVGRPRASSPATGSFRRHQAEQAAIVTEAFERAEGPDASRPLAVTPSERDSL